MLRDHVRPQRAWALSTIAVTAITALSACSSASTPAIGLPSAETSPLATTAPASLTPTPAAPPSAAPLTPPPSAPSAPAPAPAPLPKQPAAKAATDPTATATATATIVLESDGLGLAVGQNPIKHLLFDKTDSATILTAMKTVLGPVKVSPQPGCLSADGKIFVTDTLTVDIVGERFVGWTASVADGRRVRSGLPISIGSTLADVKSTLTDVTVGESSLGPGFGSATVSGSLDGLGPSNRVDTLKAGLVCVYD